MTMSEFQKTHNWVNFLHSMRSVAGKNTVLNQLRLTELNTEKIYILNKRFKLMKLEQSALYKKIKELKIY